MTDERQVSNILNIKLHSKLYTLSWLCEHFKNQKTSCYPCKSGWTINSPATVLIHILLQNVRFPLLVHRCYSYIAPIPFDPALSAAR